MTSIETPVGYWQLHTAQPTVEELGEEFANLKKSILAEYGEENIRKSWGIITTEVSKEADIIKSQGPAIIPVIAFGELDDVSKNQETLDNIRKRGVVVIRNVFPQEQALVWQKALDTYLTENKGKIGGYPAADPWNFQSYYSPVQNEVRGHPHSRAIQRFVNELWHGYSPDEALPTPLVYTDSFRHRRPGGIVDTILPHIDAGSLDRWGDDNYRKFYSSIFCGNPLAHDSYDIQLRESANSAKYGGRQQSSVLRTFQGWTALSSSGGEFGRSSFATYPNTVLGIAYVLLRPFFKPPGGDLNAPPATWELNLTDSFPGASPGTSQRVIPSLYPHLNLEDTLTLAPRINPGDAVFWHSDNIHAVDPVLEGEDTATVLYIAGFPLTRKNLDYVRRQRDSLKDNGRIPPDFAAWGEKWEGGLAGWKGDSGLKDADTRQAWGLEPIQGPENIVKWANTVLGYV